MKKCSQSHHHALAELNITPLLDLAFVLLVIFIITTTPVVNDLEVDLPNAASRAREPKPQVHYVTVDRQGIWYLDKVPVSPIDLQNKVANLRLDIYQRNETQDIKTEDISIIIRGSAKAKYKEIVNVMDMLQQANLAKVNLATEPIGEGPVRKGKE
jgi:biopolymer transport protein ExbD